MSKLLIVACTQAKTEVEFAEKPIYRSLNRHYDAGSDIFVYKDNTQGLSTCYNKAISNPEYIDHTALFVHDDVELDDLFLIDKLLTSPYSITGLAGTRSFDKRSEKAAWHLSSPREDHVGEVAHKNSHGKIWTTVFGPTQSRALLVDGLFISCRIKDLVDKQLLFDEEFSFHHYDLAFCLRANEKKVSCGVLPIRVIHHGLGDSMMTPEWEESNAKFKKLYCS